METTITTGKRLDQPSTSGQPSESPAVQAGRTVTKIEQILEKIERGTSLASDDMILLKDALRKTH